MPCTRVLDERRGGPQPFPSSHDGYPVASLAALAVVLFIVVPGCTPGIPGCEMNLPVVYLCSFLFLAAAGYSGYRICRLLLPARF